MKFSREMLKGVAPYVLLKTLDQLGESYGYQLMKTVKEQSGDVFDFSESTLYPILYRLEEKIYVESEVKEVPGKKPRRYYKLTPEGKLYLTSKTEEMKSYLGAIEKFIPGQNFV